MKRSLSLLATLSLLAAAACHDNPGLTDPRLEEFTAELELSSGHVHILSELGFTVTIENGLGHVVTSGFDSVVLERLSEGSATWRTASELTLQGQQWVGAYTFASSGAYRLRLMVTRHGATAPLHVPFHDPAMGELHAARAHAEMEGMRVEFENFPGHIHSGDHATARFWLMNPERDASGVRQPITGFTGGTILCTDPAGFEEQHTPVEVEPGVYEASHTWTEAGEAQARFRVADGKEAAFKFHVAHGH